MKSNAIAANVDSFARRELFLGELQKKETSWWGRRTSFEKFLLVLSFLSSCCLFAAAFTFTYRAQSGIEQEKSLSTEGATQAEAENSTFVVRNVASPWNGNCSKKRCIRETIPIFKNLDNSSSPCEDFYEYACGRYEGYNVTFGSSYTHIHVTNADIRKQILGFVDQPVRKEDSELLVKMKHFYNSCKYTSKLFMAGRQTLKKIVQRLGGMPVFKGDHWNASEFSWTDIMVRCSNEHASFMAFFEIDRAQSLANKSRQFLMLSPVEMMGPKMDASQNLSSKSITIYLNVLTKIATFLGAEKTRAQEEMKEVLQFQMLMSTILPENRNHKYMKLSQLQASMPEVHWKNFLEKLAGVKLQDDEPLFVHERYLMDLLRILNKTTPRTLANYAIAGMVYSLLLPMNKAKWVTQSERCIYHMAQEIFITAVDHEYIKAWIRSRARVKKQAEELVSLIKNEMHHLLQRLDWLDQKTLAEAQKKLSSMYAIVAYPEEILDYEKVAKIYENFTVSEDNFLQNIINSRRIRKSTIFSVLHEPPQRYNWKNRQLAVANAFYRYWDNSMLIPAGYLQGIMFDQDRPAYMNFAAIGSVIGHEIAHGFDYKGHKYNEKGFLRDWWDPETKEKFQERTRCMINQYSSFTSPITEQQLDGKRGIAENIADNAGVKLAYYAYQQWVKRHGPEQSLKGLSTNRLFWLSYANVYCVDKDPDTIAEKIDFYEHSPERFRINAPLANFPDFTKDFECPPNSKMNPSERCTVW